MSNPLDDTQETQKRTIQQTQETVVLTNAEMVADPGREPDSLTRTENFKYEIIKKLGKGGFAWVYLVRNLDLDRLEAMKILNADLTQDEGVIGQILKEARTTAKFQHQNIVSIHEVQRKSYWDMFRVEESIRKRHNEPFAYFTMSYVEGQTATAVLRKESRLSQKAAVRIAIDCCAALEYAHSKGVVHRDIKPDNIMVNRQGMGVVMDFGIAKAADQTRQTAAGTFMGTARYVSPEQASGQQIDGRTDIYSLGISIYELITGRVPFTSDQWMTVLYQHINESPPDPDKLCSNLDRDFRMIILKMLEKKPEDRFQTAKEAGAALLTLYQKLGGDDHHTLALDQIHTRRGTSAGDITSETKLAAPPSRRETRPAEPLPPTEQAPPKKSPLPLILGAVAVIAIAVAAFMFTRKTEPIPIDADPVANDAQPAPVTVTSKLLISAFPNGQLLAITRSDGVAVEVEQTELPLIIDLPEGNYDISFSYQGRTTVKKAVVSSSLPLSRVNAEFEVDADSFLLEDLK